MINTYDELVAAVDADRKTTLTVEIPLGTPYSAEYEEAMAELSQAKAVRSLAGNQDFLSDSIPTLEERAESLKPKGEVVYARFRRIPLKVWCVLLKKNENDVVSQYTSTIKDSFIGLFSSADSEEPITTDYRVVSADDEKSILSGGRLTELISAYLSWQGDGSGVVIHPKK